MASWASSAADIWDRCRRTGDQFRRTTSPPGTPSWGAKWKSAVRDNYLSTVTPGTGVHGSFYSYRDVYLDLDPLYKDRFGRPLVRITIDFHDNEVKQNAYLTDKFAEIIKAMGAKEVVKQYHNAACDVTEYQTTHLCGGAIIKISPLDQRAQPLSLQSRDVPNLFVMGASAFPQNAGYNPTGTVRALWTRLLRGRGDPDPIPANRGLSSMRELLARRIAGAAITSLILASSLVASGPAQTNKVGTGTNTQNFGQIERGRYLAIAGDSSSCHTVPRLRPALRRRPADRSCIRRRGRGQYNARPRHRDRRLERRNARARAARGQGA